MQTKKLIIANWKMNPVSVLEAEKLLLNVAKNISNIKKTEIVFCPPYLYLEKLKSLSKRSKKINIGAQNLFWGSTGAFTGEVGAPMLESLGIKYVILGHSERRVLGESNIDVNKKLKSALLEGLIPILCVGENTRDENHEYFNIIKVQIEECLNGIKKELVEDMIIAYEPVWSISTTQNHRNATAQDVQEVVIFIRKVIANMYSPTVAKDVRIIYGGSVNKKNILDFILHGGVTGALVGGASLDAKEFAEIVKITENANT